MDKKGAFEDKRRILEKGVVGPEEAIARIGLELLYAEGEELKSLSDLTPKEVFYLTTLTNIAEFYNSDVMENFIMNFLKFRISRMRLGRKEMLIFATGLREATEEAKKGKGIASLLSGLG
jgi:hypothetical protein